MPPRISRIITAGLWVTILWVVPCVVMAQTDGAIRLIVRGDDFGNSHAANRIMAEAFEDRAITSASVLVPAPWFAEAARIAGEHLEWSVGVHLTITAEWNTIRWGPVSPAPKVPSLIAPDGYLYNRGYHNDEPVPDCPNCARAPARAEDVEREIRAQIEAARRAGLRVDYLDCHMYATCQPDLYPVMQKVADEYCLPIADMGLLGEQKLQLGDTYAKTDYDQYVQGVLDMLGALEPGLYLYVTHPSADDPEVEAFSVIDGKRIRQVRSNDLAVWRDDRVKELMADRGIERVGVRDLWDYDACSLKAR